MSATLRKVLASVVAIAALGTPALANCELGGAAAAYGGQQVFTLADAASFLQMDEVRLATAAENGEVPGRRLAGEWRFARAALVAWLAGSDEPAECFDVEPAVEAEVIPASAPGRTAAAASPSPLLPWELGAVVGRGPSPPVVVATDVRALPMPPLLPVGPATTPSANQTPSQGAADQAVFGDAPEQESARDVALRDQVVLTPKGSFTLETELLYARQDQDLSTLAPFGIAIASRQSQDMGVTLTGRYGLRDDLQLVFGLPWVRQSEEVTASFLGTPTTLVDVSDSRFDDARVGLQYAVSGEGPGRPAVVVSADGRIPLDGSDAYALGGGVSLVKSIDPAALFGSLSYLHTFNADSRGADRLVPDNSFSAAAGLAFAMNDSLSVSAAVNSVFNPGSRTGALSQSSESYNLRVALTTVVNENFYVEPSVSLRPNGPSDAFSFGLNFSYSFED